MDFSFFYKIILKYLVLIYSQEYIYNTFEAYMPFYNKEEYIYIYKRETYNICATFV